MSFGDLDLDALTKVFEFVAVPLPLKATCRMTCAAAHKAGYAKTVTKWAELFAQVPVRPWPHNNLPEWEHHPFIRSPMYLWAQAMGGCEEERHKVMLKLQRCAFAQRETMDMLWDCMCVESLGMAKQYNVTCDVLEEVYKGKYTYRGRCPRTGEPREYLWLDTINPDNLVQRPGHLLKPVKVDEREYFWPPVWKDSRALPLDK
tara:strand:+ start:199 stop:807 length:609 start_codon:yes stop_codon:yes gene_type:complete